MKKSSNASGRRGATGVVSAVCVLALALSGGAQASKVVYEFFGNPAGQPTGNAVDGGLFNSPRGIAVNTGGTGGAGPGDVYVVNATANRIDQFTSTGQFVRGFGRDVIEEGKANSNGTAFEICDTTAGNVPSDCKAGTTTPPEAGTLSNTQGIAINQTTGHLYVTSQGLIRVDEFDATGHFVRAFGQDVVLAGPGNAPPAAAKQTLNVSATEGQFRLVFRGQTTADIAFNATAAQVDASLEALGSMGSGSVAVTGGPGGVAPYVITFSGALADAPMPLITTTPGTTPLSGGAGASVLQTAAGATGFEICTAPADTCKAGIGGAAAGAFANPLAGYLALAPAAAPNAGNVVVADPANRRINEYTGAGSFVRSFGWDAVANGPDDSSVSEQQTITVSGDGGTFTLSFNPGPGNQTTGPIKFDATPGEIEAALNGLANMVALGGRVSVSGGPGNATGSSPYTVTFGGNLSGDDVAQITSSAANLILSTGTKSVTIATPNPGSAFEICKGSGFNVCRAGAAGSGVGQFPNAGPNRLSLDSAGAVYSIEASPNFRVQKFSAAGSGLSPAVFNPPIGVAPAAFLSGSSVADAPTDVAVGDGDRVFVIKVCELASNCPNAGSGAGERRVYEFSASGNLLDTHLAGGGIASASGLSVNPVNGRLYISSTTGTHRVYIAGDPPSAAPIATTGAATAGASPALKLLEGVVNPSGSKVSNCHFEYGPTTGYGQTAPCIPFASSLGEGVGDIPVSASTEPLEPNTVYHYRLFASNVGLGAQGKDRTFTTAPAPVDNCPNAAIRAEQGVAAFSLPDCMALEQATPVVKRSQHARLPSVSAGGERINFNSQATLGDAPNRNGLGGDQFVATRTATGWTTQGLGLPAGYPGLITDSLTPDFTSWIVDGAENGTQRFFARKSDGSIEQISATMDDLTSPFIAVARQGTSEDHSHVYMEAERPASRFLADDPAPAAAASAGAAPDSNAYVGYQDATGQPTLELLGRDRHGKAWGANCGTRMGGAEAVTGVATTRYLKNGERIQGAIASDGSRVYFSTRPDQPATGGCLASSKMRIMVREETPAGPEIKELIQSECTRVAPACQNVGDEAYQGASVDQTRVYFISNRQLTNSDLDGSATGCTNDTAVPGCDLYLYDSNRSDGQQLIQVSAGDVNPGVGANMSTGITAISADGSHVYFVAKSVLTTDSNPNGHVAQAEAKNLYLYTYPDEELSFVGRLADADGGAAQNVGLYGGEGTWRNNAYPVPIAGTDPEGNHVGGDGHVLLFATKAPLSAGDTDVASDIYRYDSEQETLLHISAAAPGGSDNGSFDVTTSKDNSRAGTDYAEVARWVSEDARTILFTSAEGLVPGDTNGFEDVFMWRDGQLHQLPGGTRQNEILSANRPSMSHDGSVVAYHSSKRLLSSDGDTVQDVYVARVGGGFPTPPEVTECEGDECQGPPSLPSGESGMASATFAGSGNVRTQGRTKKCPTGKRKVKRRGKVRCVLRKRHREATHTQGGHR